MAGQVGGLGAVDGSGDDFGLELGLGIGIWDVHKRNGVMGDGTLERPERTADWLPMVTDGYRWLP